MKKTGITLLVLLGCVSALPCLAAPRQETPVQAPPAPYSSSPSPMPVVHKPLDYRTPAEIKLDQRIAALLASRAVTNKLGPTAYPPFALIAAHKKDAAATDQRYKGRLISFLGFLSKVTKGNRVGTSSVTIMTRSDMNRKDDKNSGPALCLLEVDQGKALDLPVGTYVVAIGVCDQITDKMVTLSHCDVSKYPTQIIR